MNVPFHVMRACLLLILLQLLLLPLLLLLLLPLPLPLLPLLSLLLPPPLPLFNVRRPPANITDNNTTQQPHERSVTMKPSTSAAIVLGGLLSTPATMTSASQANQQIEVTEGAVTFRVSRFGDGRTTPYRIYFWDKGLTGSSYRFDEDGHVVYFKAGSKVYHDRTEMDDGSLYFMSKREMMKKHKGHGGEMDDSSSSSSDDEEEEFDTYDCAQCTTALSAVCDSGLPEFCDGLDPHCLHRDGYSSVSTLCTNYESACATAVGACDAVCANEAGESHPRSGSSR